MKKNINNKINLNSNNDLALLLNKKIEDLNLSLESYKKEKNQLNKDLILKNKTINELTIKINRLINKNKNVKLDIDQKNNIRLFFKGKKQKNGIDKKLYDYIDKIINYEMRKHKNEINIIKTNLFQLIPKKLIFSFNGEELYRIINRTL